MLRLLDPGPAGLAQAAAALTAGELVGLPTETVYGLAANALNSIAVAKVFEAKRRPRFDPLIVHAPSLESAFGLASQVPAGAVALARAFWPGPLTLVLPRSSQIPDLVASDLPTVALRVPAHPVARALLQRLRFPLAAPSANRFGRVSPTSALHVVAEFPALEGWVLDGGECSFGLESTVVSFETGQPEILRHGAVPREALEQVGGTMTEGARVLERPLAPGQLARHYATQTPLRLIGAGAALPPAGQRRGAALLVVAGQLPEDASEYSLAVTLSARADLAEAAAGLFAAMRSLDEGGFTRIDAVGCRPIGLGRAILDRLVRAAATSGESSP